MAQIGAAVFGNPTLLEICSTTSATLPPTINNPNGRTYSMEHKLVVTGDSSDENYYPSAVAGKTGYTSLAGQTLVTYAEQDGRRQVAVTLKSTQRTIILTQRPFWILVLPALKMYLLQKMKQTM